MYSYYMKKFYFSDGVFIILFLFVFSSLLQADEKKDDYKFSFYPEAGILFGSPAFPNFSAGYWFGPFGLRVSGMYNERHMNGIQFDAAFKLSDSRKFMHSIGAAVGRSQDPGCDYSYAGPAYSFNYKGFFLEAGVSKVFNVQRGDFSDLPYWVIFQVGYMWRFLPE